jgi:hypothetical protein
VEIASFAIACAAFVIGGISLAWQIISWRRSGPVVVVDAHQSFPVFAGDRPGDLHTQVTARNRGRAAVTVTSWGFSLPTGENAFWNATRWSTSLPHRLEPHSEASWFVDTDSIKFGAAQNGVAYQSLRAYVTLANGKCVNAKRRGIGLQ